jgi:hypothetical protein
MTTITLRAALAMALCSLPALSQTPDYLIGHTQLGNLRQVDHFACAVLGQCPAPLPAVVVLPPWAGGTAWDPVRPGAWVTNGLLLAKFSDACAPQCPPQPIPTLGPNAFITGLEVVESQNQLWMVDSLGNLHFYTNTCPPQPLGVCNTGLMPMAPQTFTSGLAVDEGNGYVFVSHCDFLTGANFIAVAPLATPCAISCRLPLPPCALAGFGTVRGLAVNWGRRILFATDGINTTAVRYQPAGPCVQFIGNNCCFPPQIGFDPMVGLALRPGGATSAGAPCANGSCAPCPMVHSLGNDPNLGNAFFNLRLDQAPAGSLAWCILGTGPCTLPGVVVSPLCGPIYATPVLGSLGPNLTGGGGGLCSGGAVYSFPLPAAPGLAGWVLSSQCVALCNSPIGIGTAVSNCLSFMLQGN